MFNSYQYRPLFEITFLHGYCLNIGDVDYDDLSEDEKKVALKRYNFEEVFELVPLMDTRNKLKNHRIIQKSSSSGVKMSIQTQSDDGLPLIDPEDDLSFVYALKAKDSYFKDYTDCPTTATEFLLLTNNQPSDLKDENGLSVSLGESAKIIPRFSQDRRINKTYLLDESDSNLVTDNYLTALDKIGLIALVHIQIKGANNASSALNSQRKVKNNYPHFKVHFDPISTFWKYKQQTSGFEAETISEKTLSKYGFVEIDPTTDFTVAYLSTDPEAKYNYPNPSPGNIEIQEGSGSDPDKIYSVIYI